MNGQDEFDDILKNKLESQEFPFDESNWEKASGMIDASRNALRDKLDAEEFPFDEANWNKAAALIDASRDKKRRPAAIYFIAAGLLLTLGLTGWFLFNTNDTPVASARMKETTGQSEQPAFAPAENHATTSSVPDEPAEKTLNTEALKAGQQETTRAVTEKRASEARLESYPEQAAAKAQRVPAPSASPDDLRTDIGKKISNGTYEQMAASTKASKKETGFTTNANESSTGLSAGQSEATKEKGTSGEAPLTPFISSEAKTMSNPEINSTIALGTAAAIDSAAQTQVAAVPVKGNTATEAATKESKFRTEREPRSFIYAEAGTNYLLGWRNLDEKDANGFNPVFGLHFFHMFKNKLGITAGSQYNCVGNLNYSSHTSTVTHYDFGKVDDVTIITPTKIHYVSGILKLNYAIKKNNIFGIGCNISYLLNVDNKVETYNERDNHISQVQISKTSGYVDGFRTIDLQATLSYRRVLYKDFGAGIEFFYGLTDVKTNGFFNTNFFERNTGMKVSLNYNIFKK
ncbi:MAG: hypothetical protein ACXVPQ_00215 [Bacteroidia bacterium]